jgi:hypothetical protein
VSERTEPESFGQPDPEKTIFVIRGDSGGAAMHSAGRARKRIGDRMIALLIRSVGGKCGSKGQ